MPNFNYENPSNINGNALETEEEMLVKAALDILVTEGFTSITSAKLKKAGIEEGLLCKAHDRYELFEMIFEEIQERIKLRYEYVTSQAADYLEKGVRNTDASWRQLECLLYRHIYTCFHPKNRNYVLLVTKEQSIPYEYRERLTETLNDCFGKYLTTLILEVSEVKNEQIAAMLSCNICGSINIFVEQPEYCKRIFKAATGSEPNYAVIEDFLNNCFLRTIAANTSINKVF